MRCGIGAMKAQRRFVLILLASSSEETLANWKRGVSDFASIDCLTGLDQLKDELVRVKPQILLLDHNLSGLDAPAGLADLMILSPATKIIILSRALSDEEEWGLFKAGVRGVAQEISNPNTSIVLSWLFSKESCGYGEHLLAVCWMS